ncbi:putative transferase CAF17 homolog, mitochondrial isoform X2 [Nilaparvata lugens]|uniref:putative transferase CAF17 homolog, mitochondrial isoform X2 n=1 Tax=Nilaparvata lugens TaxID=108931 RepID=UPI00193D90AD|nr:putative transferase CAF17 homolog, mitochondrial isoform X2 [Nilaparvata lugens]
MIAITRRLFTQDRIYRTLHQLTSVSVCNSHTYCVEQLGERAILEVTGTDASSFLQGLITNDIRHLDDGSKRKIIHNES